MSPSRCAGWLLAGRYRLLSELGRGGMGRVWRAHDELLDRQVAVKEVTLGNAIEAERERLLGRTMREARLAARLSHPHIAAVYDVVVADERPWIVLQLVPSRSLADVIAERGPLSVPDTARLGLQVLEALSAAHADGIVHRDVKPGNILLNGDRHALLTDFGLATTLDDQSNITQSGMVVGTPAYIAPERLRGGHATPQADLWSLGATLYAAVEGQSPFPHSGHLAALTAVLTSEPAPFHLAGPLAPVIAGLLEKDPDRRIDGGEVRRRLTRVAALRDEEPQDTAAIPMAAAPPHTGDLLPPTLFPAAPLPPPATAPQPPLTSPPTPTTSTPAAPAPAAAAFAATAPAVASDAAVSEPASDAASAARAEGPRAVPVPQAATPQTVLTPEAVLTSEGVPSQVGGPGSTRRTLGWDRVGRRTGERNHAVRRTMPGAARGLRAQRELLPFSVSIPQPSRPQRWRQLTALAALVTSVLVTTSWSGDEPATPRTPSYADPAPDQAPEHTGIMHAVAVSRERTPERASDRAPEQSPSRHRPSGRPLTQTPAQPPAAVGTGPGKGKKLGHQSAKTKHGNGLARGHTKH
ncbi:serine/threonine-protein kinase [Nonomuraea sp. NPDC051191]|uniref:serine/threonine-protein kinase n=1 Tax=Nonomuraea sp. NPDC051191 TaxID=3364372 RepID=UPI00379C84CB